MAKEQIKILIEGGKATAAPPLGPALGPLGVNIGQVVADINKATAALKGMQVPVTVVVDTDTKQYEIKVGTPPVSALIKKEAGIEKGSGNPKEIKVGELLIEQVIKIAKMKKQNLLGKTLKECIKEVIGTCNSMGIAVEGMPAKEALRAVDQGRFDDKILAEKTELSEEEKKRLEEQKARLEAELAQKKAEFETRAKELMGKMKGKTDEEIKEAMKKQGIPQEIINQVISTKKKEEAEKT